MKKLAIFILLLAGSSFAFATTSMRMLHDQLSDNTPRSYQEAAKEMRSANMNSHSMNKHHKKHHHKHHKHHHHHHHHHHKPHHKSM